jgi:hypothetical protein
VSGRALRGAAVAALVLGAVATIAALALETGGPEAFLLRRAMCARENLYTMRSSEAATRLVELRGDRAVPALIACLEAHARTPPPAIVGDLFPAEYAFPDVALDEVVERGGAALAADLVRIVRELEATARETPDRYLLVFFLVEVVRDLARLDPGAAAEALAPALRAVAPRGGRGEELVDMEAVALLAIADDLEARGLLDADARATVREARLGLTGLEFAVPELGETPQLWFSVGRSGPVTLLPRSVKLVLDGGEEVDFGDRLVWAKGTGPDGPSLVGGEWLGPEIDDADPARRPLAVAASRGATGARFVATIAILDAEGKPLCTRRVASARLEVPH